MPFRLAGVSSGIPNVGVLCLSVRRLYWTDQGTETGIPSKVAAADMDGSNPVVLFTNSLEHVEFLTLDLQENKLYWAVTGTGMVGPAPRHLHMLYIL